MSRAIWLRTPPLLHPFCWQRWEVLSGRSFHWQASDVRPLRDFCQVEGLKQHNFDVQESMDTLWLCVCGFVASLMHAGFAMLETGRA